MACANTSPGLRERDTRIAQTMNAVRIGAAKENQSGDARELTERLPSLAKNRLPSRS
jgi:hypothetical protein